MGIIDYSLYLLTDRDMLMGRDLLSEVRKAVKGGVSMVQLREKNCSSREFYNLALTLKTELAKMHVPLIINDRLDIALAVDADGLHIGQNDIPINIARKFLSSDKILGLSVNNLEQAKKGEFQGASYLGAGPVFYTSSKKDIDNPTGLKFLETLKRQIKIPVIAIGGINHENIQEVKKTGTDGVAVISAILSANDCEKASQRMIQLWNQN